MLHQQLYHVQPPPVYYSLHNLSQKHPVITLQPMLLDRWAILRTLGLVHKYLFSCLCHHIVRHCDLIKGYSYRCNHQLNYLVFSKHWIHQRRKLQVLNIYMKLVVYHVPSFLFVWRYGDRWAYQYTSLIRNLQSYPWRCLTIYYSNEVYEIFKLTECCQF